MAVDKLVDSTQLNADLTSVANAIRTKGGTSADLAFPSGFVSAVQAIPAGGTPTIGLIDEIDVENGVKLITYDLPALALSYGVVWADCDITFTNDYLYGLVVNSVDLPNDNTGYMAQADSYSGIMTLPFRKAVIVNNVILRGYHGMMALDTPTQISNRIVAILDTEYAFARVVFKLFSSKAYFTGGKIRLYGRIA